MSPTGRNPSTTLPLQNIPLRTELGRRLHKAFERDPIEFGIDYGVIERRLLPLCFVGSGSPFWEGTVKKP